MPLAADLSMCVSDTDENEMRCDVDAWLTMTAMDLGRGIETGDICPIELTETYLAAIDAHPISLRIYTRVTHDRARAEAQVAKWRAEADQRLGPLDGVPVSWKDLFDTADIVTEAGSKILAGRTPTSDARVLASATAAGTVCLGKTHMSELAFSGLGLNPVMETSPCVNDHMAVSGGSSSGAATSVAFGLAPLAIGSDTGGSVRIPAAWNDLVGLKTTSGRLSLTGVVPLCERFDTVGPLARSVDDAAAALAAMERRDFAMLEPVSLAGLRVGVLETIALDDVRDAPMRGFQRGLDAMTNAGAAIERFECDAVTSAMDLTGILFTTEAYGTWRDVIEETPDLMFPEILGRFRSGAQYSGADYVAAWRRLTALRAEYASATAQYDVVITPTSAILPPNIERLLSDRDYYVTENLLSLRNTRIGNIMGLAALTIPTGIASTGIQLMSPPNTEERLLAIGKSVESALA